MKQSRSNWPKNLLQWGTLGVLFFFLSGLAGKLFPKMDAVDPERLCPFGGLQALATFFQRGSLPCSMSSLQIMMGIALAAAVILFSKLFCAYLCPVGTVEDLLIRLRKALKIKTVRVGILLDKILRIVKYALLFWIVYMTVTASELFCKNLDPYYAVATGFKGEITLWMSIVTVGIVILLGLFIDRFWCKYVCPLGAISNTLKFWVWLVVLALAWWVLSLLGVHFSWVWLLGTFCVAGYLLEIVDGRPKLEALRILKDEDACTHCGRCSKACPYGIDISQSEGSVTNVDCTLCGECVAACPEQVLRVGVCPSNAGKRRNWAKFIPALLAVLLVAGAWWAGTRFELPTISETWGVEEGMKLETLKISPLKSVKCYGSSMAFKARMEKVRGVHGVKTFVGSHTVEIAYDPSATTEDKIREEVFTPSHFRIWTPDPEKVPELKWVTLRTEKMYDKLDLNYLGLQFRTTGKSIFGVESEYNCPLIVRVYMAPDEELDEAWFKEVVNRKVLAMPVHGGGVKETPVDFEFVRMDPDTGTIPVAEYLEKMFDPFTAEVNGSYTDADGNKVVEKRKDHYKGQPQYIYEIVNQNYEKPIIKRALPFLSNHLSTHEGFIGLYLRLNKELKPALQFRFAEPLTGDEIWNLITQEKWTITYAKDDVREEGARLKFEEPGTVYPYEGE